MPSAQAARLSMERLCSFVAVQRTQKGDEVLRQLVLHTFVTGPVERLQNAGGVQAVIQELFGLDLAQSRLQAALDRLLQSTHLARDAGGRLEASAKSRQNIQQRLRAIGDLQARVRETWLKACVLTWPDLNEQVAWRALDTYLTEVFKQHGMYSVALLDPTAEVPPEYQESMGAILQRSLVRCCAPEQRKVVEDAVVRFLAEARTDADRAAYISQLADAAFSYFAISAPPEVASRLREQLKPLTIFVDTNALFAVVGLDERDRIATVGELLDIIRKHSLPYRPRYHERTGLELRSTLDSVITGLRSRHWPPGVSRAAAHSPFVSTIERLYHERNAELPLTPSSFFEPFEHIDVLLESKGVRIYRDPGRTDDRRVFDMMADYKEFLAKYKREKPYDSVDHDTRLLDCVRRLRSKAPSSLDAEALLVTFDFLLFRFAWAQSKRRGERFSVVLPSQLLQLLRPFVAGSPDFDRSFAAAFSFAEFRSLDHKSSVAARRMLEIIAAYKDIPEETVASLLANKLLFDRLRAARSDKELQTFVESAIAAENATLVEQQAALREKLAAEQALRAATEASAREVKDRAQADVAGIKQRLDETQRVQEKLAQGLAEEQELRERAREREAAAVAAKEEAEKQAQSAEGRAAELKGLVSELEFAQARTKERVKVALGVAKALGLTVVVGLLLEMFLPHDLLSWLARHPDSYGLRGAGYALILALSVSAFVPKWRGWALGGAGLGLVLVLLQLLGGPA